MGCSPALNHRHQLIERLAPALLEAHVCMFVASRFVGVAHGGGVTCAAAVGPSSMVAVKRNAARKRCARQP